MRQIQKDRWIKMDCVHKYQIRKEKDKQIKMGLEVKGMKYTGSVRRGGMSSVHLQVITSCALANNQSREHEWVLLERKQHA